MKQKAYYMAAAETITMFCRLIQVNKSTLPIRSSEMGLLIYTTLASEPITSLDAVYFF